MWDSVVAVGHYNDQFNPASVDLNTTSSPLFYRVEAFQKCSLCFTHVKLLHRLKVSVFHIHKRSYCVPLVVFFLPCHWCWVCFQSCGWFRPCRRWAFSSDCAALAVRHSETEDRTRFSVPADSTSAAFQAMWVMICLCETTKLLRFTLVTAI